MKKNHQLNVIITIIFILAFQHTQAQKLEWANVYTASNDISATYGITTDALGNVYHTGVFRGTYDFDLSSATDTRTSAGSNDIFIQKLDASGNHLWVVTLGSTASDWGADIAVDNLGNVYVAGNFTGTVDFDPSVSTQNRSAVGSRDVFVLKLNGSGAFQWVYNGGGTGADEANAIALDSNGWPYIVGETNGGNFNPSVPAQVIGSQGGRDVFYIKLNSSGTFQWGYSAGSFGDDEAFDLTITSDNQLYISGTFEGTVDFDPGLTTTRNRTSVGDKDAFVLWVNSSGNDLGVYAFGGTERETANGIGLDSEGSIYVCGTFDETVDFDAGSGTASESIGDTNDDFYILKLQSNLTFDWVETQTQSVTTYYFNDLSINSSDQIFFGGAMTPVSKGFVDIYDKDGTQLLDGIDIYPKIIYTMHADANNYFIGGPTNGAIHFDACEFGAFQSSSNKAFTAKYSFEQEADIPTFVDNSPSTFAGESTTLTIASGDLNGATVWQWYAGSCGGTMVGTGTSISVSPSVETTYYVRGEGYSCIDEGSCASVTVTIASPELTYSGNGFTEDTENFGGVEGQLDVSIAGDRFTNQGGTLTFKTDYSLSNIPAGLSPSIAVAADGQTAVLTLSGESSVHQDTDDISNILFSFANSAFQGGDVSVVINATTASSNIGIDFNDNNPVLTHGYPYQVDNLTNIGSFDLSNEEELPQGVAFNQAGTKMYVVGRETARIHQYSLARPYNVTNGITYDNISYDVSNEDADPRDIMFNDTGSKMYILGQNSDAVYQYSLATPFNISAGVSPQGSLSVGPGFPFAFTFDQTGHKLIVGKAGLLLQYSLSSAFDITGGSASLDGSVALLSTSNRIHALEFNADGSSLILLDYNTRSVREYSLGSSYDVLSGTSLLQSTYLGSLDSEPLGMALNKFGTRMFFIGHLSEAVFQLDMGAGGFQESNANDGTVTGEIVMQLHDDRFTNAGGSFIGGVQYIIPNLPSGLSPLFSISGNGSTATLTFTGAANASDKSDNVESLNIFFSDAAFELGNNDIVANNGNVEHGLGVDFVEGPEVTSESFSVPEGSANGTLVGTISATDPGMAGLTYSITAGNDLGGFQVGGSTGEITVANSNVLDFETNPSFFLTVEVNDGTLTGSGTITINLNDLTEAPTDILLDNSTIDENEVSGTIVGTFSTEDIDAGETYAYSLVSGSGSTDNSAFVIDGDELKSVQAFDFETKSSYSIRVNTNDGNGGNFAKEFIISVIDISEAPTSIALSANTIAENEASGTVVGSFGTTDQDAGETYTYTLIAGPGSSDNASFNIVGVELQTAEVFDFETKSTYSIRVNTNDGNGGDFAEELIISVVDISEAPTSIALSANSIAENEASGTVVGSFSTTDQDEGETYTYTLIAGPGSSDNASFNIVGVELQTAEVFDFETKSTYSIRVNTNDGNGGDFAMEFTISISDVSEGLECGVPSLSVDNVSGTDADLSWNPFFSAQGYELQYRIYGTSVWTTVSAIVDPVYSLTDLLGLQTYQVRVRPLCGSTPLWSPVVLFTTGSGPNCGIPTIAVGAISGTDVGLIWTSFGTATYELQYRIYGTGMWTTESGLTAALRDFTGSELVALQTYQVRVRTLCPGGGAPTAWSSVMLFTTGGGANCGVPTISVDAISGTAVDLSWTSFGTATYEMQYRIYGSSVWTTESNLLTAGRSFTGTELLGLQTYQVRVRTQCPGGGAPSAWSSVTLFTTGGGTNCMIPVPGVDALGMTTADISWTSSTGATYNLLYREYGTTVWTTQTGVGTASIQLTGLTASTRYQFRVRANCGAGSLTPYSSVLNFTTDGAGGRTLDGQQDKETVTEQLDQQEQITLDIYPNPVITDMLTIRLSKAADQIEMTMHSMEGRLIIPQLNRMGESQYQINTTGLSNGVYVLNISYDGNREIRRVMIRK